MSLPPPSSPVIYEVDVRGQPAPASLGRPAPQPGNAPNVPVTIVAAEEEGEKDELEDDDEDPAPSERSRKRGSTRKRLHDDIADDLDVLFTGIGPGKKAVDKNQPFPDGNSHTFYQALLTSGWTVQRHPSSAAHTFPGRYNIGMTTLIRDLAVKSTKPQFRRHVPAWIEKILRYRPQVVCLLGLAKFLGAVEQVFHTWAGEKKCEPIGSYTNEEVSIDWILRKWKIVHPDDGRGRAVTYITVVVNSGGQAGIDPELRAQSFRIVRQIAQEVRAGTFVEPANMRTVNLEPYHQIIRDRDQMIADLYNEPPLALDLSHASPPVHPRKRSASDAPSMVVPPKRARVARSPPVNAVAGPSRHANALILTPSPSPSRSPRPQPPAASIPAAASSPSRVEPVVQQNPDDVKQLAQEEEEIDAEMAGPADAELNEPSPVIKPEPLPVEPSAPSPHDDELARLRADLAKRDARLEQIEEERDEAKADSARHARETEMTSRRVDQVEMDNQALQTASQEQQTAIEDRDRELAAREREVQDLKRELEEVRRAKKEAEAAAAKKAKEQEERVSNHILDFSSVVANQKKTIAEQQQTIADLQAGK